MEKRTKQIAGVGTERHKQAVKNIASHVSVFPPSESQIVCMSVLFTEHSLKQGQVTMEDLYQKFHFGIFGR
jgi:hypothetical protein